MNIILKPLQLKAELPDSEGRPRYSIAFERDGTKLEHYFALASNRGEIIWDKAFADEMGERIDQAKPLLDSIMLFDEAVELMQTEGEPIEGMLPGGIPSTFIRKKMKPIALKAGTSKSDHTQQFIVTVICEGTEIDYVLTVENDGIVGVKPEPRFSKDMGANNSPAVPLFQSVLAFFNASRKMA